MNEAESAEGSGEEGVYLVPVKARKMVQLKGGSSWEQEHGSKGQRRSNRQEIKQLKYKMRGQEKLWLKRQRYWCFEKAGCAK